MTFGSLFAGIGGLDLGLERAGMECRWQVEIEPYAIKVLRKHWPGVKRHGDITKLSGDDLEPVDVICGGFPCQDLSRIGKHAGIEGTRSGLWFEFARLVRELGPDYVLIENVAEILVYDAMRRVIGELAGSGYVGCWRSLRAWEFGASHLRKRVFIVACRAEGLLGNAECTGLEIGSGKRGQHARQTAESLTAGVPPGLPVFAPGPSAVSWPAILAERPDLAPALESPIRGMADGFSDRVDGTIRRAMSDRNTRLARLGNAVVPEIPEWIGGRIMAFDASRRAQLPAWVPCPDCEEFFCTVHSMHVSDCACPPIDQWLSDPYSTQGRELTQV